MYFNLQPEKGSHFTDYLSFSPHCNNIGYRVQMNLRIGTFEVFFHLRNDLPLMAFLCTRKLYHVFFRSKGVLLHEEWQRGFNNLQNTFGHWQSVSRACRAKEIALEFFFKVFDAVYTTRRHMVYFSNGKLFFFICSTPLLVKTQNFLISAL